MKHFRIKIDFTTVDNDSMFTGREGEIEVNTEAPVDAETLKNSEELKLHIAGEMKANVGESVFSVDIKSIEEFNPTNQ